MIGLQLLIDTNRYRDIDSGVPEVVSRAQQAAVVCVPLIVLAELRSGFHNGNRPAENEQQLQQFLSAPGVKTLSPDEQTTHHYAEIFVQLKRTGKMIPTNDIWIAALALQHDLVLDTRDEHFKRVDGLKLV